MAEIQKTVLKSKVTLSDFPAKAIGAAPPDVVKLDLGIIMGIANDVVIRRSPGGDQVFEGLRGTFEARPFDMNRDVIRSGVLFFPDAFHSLVRDQLLRDIKEGENAGEVERLAESVQFAFVVSVVRASNPVGYSWSLEPVGGMAPSVNDPLAALRSIVTAALPAPDAAAMETGTVDTSAPAAPPVAKAPAAAKGGKK